MAQTNSNYNKLINHENGKEYQIDQLQTCCTEFNEPLVAQYELAKSQPADHIQKHDDSMWRYKSMLPILDDKHIISLGEGMTPILDFKTLASRYGFNKLAVKEESANPTGSFKARGLSMAVSKAFELGANEFCIPTAGNAGSALSAYCAKAGLTAHIFMPRATPKVFQIDCRVMGAEVSLIDGSISDAGKAMREANADGQWFDVTTLKEPFRLEGKKTMGYEIAEQREWKVPDVIVYPTGGGTGLIGIWKAFKEMKEMGWIDTIPTRMVAVQTNGCDPIVQAFTAGLHVSAPFQNPAITIANGLRVPHAFGHKLILKTLYESEGCAVGVSEDEMIGAIRELSEREGLFVSPEGAAVWHATKSLRQQGWITESDDVLMLNTGSGYKYIENLFDTF